MSVGRFVGTIFFRYFGLSVGWLVGRSVVRSFGRMVG